MRVLYISGGGPGGITSHVRCLTQCLKGVADVAVCILGESDVLRPMLDADGTKYYLCPCSSGHDLRIALGLRRAIRDFQPDVLHFQGISLIAALYAKLFTRIPRVCSIHTPSGRHPDWDRHILNLSVMPCYWLPVSTSNWEGFKSAYPKAKGEVFFNPIRVGEAKAKVVGEQRNGKVFVVGMVGRNADQKDWPSFHKVENIVKRKVEARGSELERCEFRDLAERKVDEWLSEVTRESFQAALEKLVNEKSAANEYRYKRPEERELAIRGTLRFYDEFSRKIITLSDGRCVYFAPDARAKARNANDLSRCWAEYAFHAVSNGGARIPEKGYNERWYNPHKVANFNLIETTFKLEQCYVRLDLDSRYDTIVFDGGVAAGFSFQVVARLDGYGNVEANLTEVTFTTSSKMRKKLPRLVALAEAVQTVVHHQTTPGSYPLDEGSIANPRLAVNEGRDLQLAFLNAGEERPCDGREAIAKMDLFVMTSKHEELPTVVLECFLLGTPICGFIPVGGMNDIISFSKGPLRDAFITERNCDKLADIVMDLMQDPEKRKALVEDGRQILENHFDAEKNCRSQLMDIYRKVIDEWR